MIQDNPLFSKESFKEVTSLLSFAISDLRAGSDDGSNLENQRKAAKELTTGYWIIATIVDHVFDFYPYQYFLADGQEPKFLAFRQRFIDHPGELLQQAISTLDENLAVLDTLNRDNHLVKEVHRNLEKERHARDVLLAIQDNLGEFVTLLHSPKKVSDSGKPSADEIKTLISSIKRVSDRIWKENEINPHASLEETLQFTQMFEMFLNPLYMAWQVYHYGWHSDFWKEGDSMWGYMMFEVKAEEIIPKLIEVLETQSPFTAFEIDGSITNGLLKVYRHLITVDWKGNI